MSLILNDKRRVGEWARSRIRVESWGDWYEAIGLEHDGTLVAAVVYTWHSDADVHMHIAVDCGGRYLTREALRAAFRYPFRQLGCRRVTGLIAAKNDASRRIAEKLGFVREGVKRHGMPDDDLIVYGLLREECRFV